MAKYIGGNPTESRIKYLEADAKLISIVNRLSEMYGINPLLMLNRLSKEGLVDRAINAHNNDVKNNKPGTSIVDRGVIDVLKDLGLDDSHTHIQNGSIKLLREIPYKVVTQVNAKGRKTYAAQPETSIDALEIMAAQLKSFQDKVSKAFPKLKGDKLDVVTNAAYNMGLSATKKHLENNNINFGSNGRYTFNTGLRALNIDSLSNVKRNKPLEETSIINRALVGLGWKDYNINDEYKDVDGVMKKFGGKLRYGWGGFADTLDILEGRLQNDGMINNFTGFKQNDNMYVYSHPSGMQPPMQGTTSYPIFTGEGYIRSYDSDSNKFIFTDIDSIPNAGSPTNGDAIYHDVVYLNDHGSKYLTDYNNQYKPLYINMQDRISKDISQQRNLTAQQIARFGGLVGVRRKYPYGGNYVENNIPAYSGYIGWGTEVKPEDIAYSDYEAKGEGIVGSEVANKAGMIGGIGAGIGTAAGAAAGTALGAWGGPIGMAAGALLGTLIGIFTGRKKRKEEEANRRELLAEQREANRQNTISNMNNRYENDVAKIRTAMQPTTFSGQSFYMKYGGLMKPRMKYNNGGTILPNSSDTAVAYGRTHEQVNPMTGETGITYGNAEVEGGGLVGNKELPGEVIQQTLNGDRIYSDSLYVPGTRATYAQIAKTLTDKKGAIEQEISTLQETLDNSLDAFNKAKLAKAKTGTATRNIEKLASKLNLKTGELAQVDAQLNDVFTSQEQMATVLGLRDTAPVTARFGGYRPKYKFGIPEVGLLTNTFSSIGNIIATGLSSKSNLAQLDFLSKIPVPKTNKVEAEDYTIDTTPYEEAARKMASETRRFNKWIEDNVSNPQVLRNQKRKNLISYYEGLGDINAKKSAYLSSRYDLSRNARIAANNANNQGEYQDALNEYNKKMSIGNARISVNNQTTQNYMAAINQLMQAVGSYGNQKMYLASLPTGVQNEFYFGKPRTATTSTIATSKLYNDYLLNKYGQSFGITNPFTTPRFLFNPYALG